MTPKGIYDHMEHIHAVQYSLNEMLNEMLNSYRAGTVEKITLGLVVQKFNTDGLVNVIDLGWQISYCRPDSLVYRDQF